jgi:hypothetical protein
MKTFLEFFARRGFVVLTHNAGQHEAWAYEGPLGFDVAAPFRFGLGPTPIDALKALDWQLEKMAKATPAPMAAPLPLTCPSSSPKHRRPNRLDIDARELATILAALRFHQDENLQGRSEIADLTIQDIATDGGILKPLTFQEVDVLCERLNGSATLMPRLHVEPPPRDKGKEPLHRVVYVIDVPAKNPRQAARRTHQILSNRESWPPILQVIDQRGRVTVIDLASCSSGSVKPT